MFAVVGGKYGGGRRVAGGGAVVPSSVATRSRPAPARTREAPADRPPRPPAAHQRRPCRSTTSAGLVDRNGYPITEHGPVRRGGPDGALLKGAPRTRICQDWVRQRHHLDARLEGLVVPLLRRADPEAVGLLRSTHKKRINGVPTVDGGTAMGRHKVFCVTYYDTDIAVLTVLALVHGGPRRRGVGGLEPRRACRWSRPSRPAVCGSRPRTALALLSGSQPARSASLARSSASALGTSRLVGTGCLLAIALACGRRSARGAGLVRSPVPECGATRCRSRGTTRCRCHCGRWATAAGLGAGMLTYQPVATFLVVVVAAAASGATGRGGAGADGVRRRPGRSAPRFRPRSSTGWRRCTGRCGASTPSRWSLLALALIGGPRAGRPSPSGRAVSSTRPWPTTA